MHRRRHRALVAGGRSIISGCEVRRNLADHDTCARRRVCDTRNGICRRSCPAATERDVVHGESEITLVALFSQNGFETVKDGAPVDIVFDNLPGRIYQARVIAIPKGIGHGQVAVSGTLAKTSAIGGATAFPAVVSIPEDMSRDSLRLGMSGSATAFSPKAGMIGLLASILVWISSYTAYL
jgi:hypothetical protein